MPISYQLDGPAEASPLVFIHGLGADSKQTTAAFQGLDSVRLVAPDMPGHGASQNQSTEKLGFDEFADLTVDLIRQLGYASVHLGGLSMGSGIAINIALRYPQYVDSLVLLRPSWLNHPRPSHLTLVARVGQWIEQQGTEAARQLLLDHPDYQSLDTLNPPVAASILALFERPTTPASTAVLYQMWQDSPFDSLNDLREIRQPTLVLSTSRDELHPASSAHHIAAAIPAAQQTELPARYHHAEAYAAELRHAVEQFLA